MALKKEKYVIPKKPQEENCRGDRQSDEQGNVKGNRQDFAQENTQDKGQGRGQKEESDWSNLKNPSWR